MNIEEQNIITQFKKGNEKAFDHIFNTFYKALVVFSYGITKDRAQAEEVVQEFFVKFWENREKFDLKFSLKAYLYRAVYNNSVKVAKKNILISHIEHESELPNQIDFNDLMEQTELEEKIYNSIESLPKQCRKVFKMSRFEELKYREIAEKLSISVKTVENQISKALKVLTKELGSYLKTIILMFF